MNFLCMRGKQDNGTSNDLSVLWDTYLDNFAIYYTNQKQDVNLATLYDAKAEYLEKIANLSQDSLSADVFVRANIAIKQLVNNIGFITQEDANYLASVMKDAVQAIPAQVNVKAITLPTELSITAGLSQTVVAQLNPVDANEALIWSSANEEIAVVSYDGKTAVIRGVKVGSTEITVRSQSNVSAVVKVNVVGNAYLFGNLQSITADSSYANGVGFNNFTYKTAANGWVDGIYYPRKLTKEAGSSYVNKQESANDYLAINSVVWSENGGDRDEDIIVYENTSAFDLDLAHGNYTVSVNFINPTKNAMNVIVKAEDITRYSSGDHKDTELAKATILAGQTKTVSFDIALMDDSLTLRFEQDGVANSFNNASVNTVYVKSVSVVALEEEKTEEVPTVYILGDSTVQTYTRANYRTGWGQVFYTALSGATESSIIEETSEGYAYYLSLIHI